MSLVLNKLREEDIDEKIRLNEESGIDIYKLKELLKQEQLDFIWTKIRCEVQCQFLTEQIAYIEKRIKAIEEKAISESTKT